MKLQGKQILVTGAAKRVGREIALELARHGASILLHYRSSKTDAEKTAQEIRGLGVECKLFQADLSDVRQIEKLCASLPAVDALVNSASSFYKTPIESVTEEQFEELISSNLKAPFFLAKELGLQMAKKNGGRIINIVDWSAFRPYKDYSAYCASKGGLVTLTKSLARDLAPKVFCNGIAPGPVMLPEDFTEAEAQAIAKLTALGKIGKPQDIAKAAVFLLENDFVNGTVLVVDGGRSIV